jgi:hypothetical protein
MTALVWMRLTAFARTGRPLAPLVAVLVVLGILYGGGQAQAGEAYGVSAVVLFPVLAWHTKLLLDTEPDGQRRLARVTLGSAPREAVAGLVAALTSAVPLLVVALVLPWLVGGVRGPRTPADPSLAAGLVAGVWAHLVMVAPALALGALASRAVAGSFGRGATVLLVGVIGTIVVQARHSPLSWLGPPLISAARAAAGGLKPATAAAFAVQALAWAAVAIAGYGWLRRDRP